MSVTILFRVSQKFFLYAIHILRGLSRKTVGIDWCAKAIDGFVNISVYDGSRYLKIIAQLRLDGI